MRAAVIGLLVLGFVARAEGADPKVTRRCQAPRQLLKDDEAARPANRASRR
jgi:hypothetical protein